MDTKELKVALSIDTSKLEESLQKCSGIAFDLQNLRAIASLKRLVRRSEYQRIKHQYEPKTFLKYPSDGLETEMIVVDEIHEYRG